jgi:hypothetical protein
MKQVRSGTHRSKRHHAPHSHLEQWDRTEPALNESLQLQRRGAASDYGRQSATTAGSQQTHQSCMSSGYSAQTTRLTARSITPARAWRPQQRTLMYAVAHNQAYVRTQVELVSWIIVLPPRRPSMPSYPPPSFLPLVVGQTHTHVRAPSIRRALRLCS